MGGAPVAIAQGVEAIYWNPAGLDLAERAANAFFSYRRHLADMNLSYAVVSARFKFGSVALSWRSLDIGDIPVTTEFYPDGTGEIFSPTFFVAGATYSKRLTDRITVGASVNLISESWGEARVAATGLGLDAGVQYRGLVGIRHLALGVVIKNVGPPMRYGGSGLWVQAEVPGSERGVTFYRTQAASFELPSVVEIGLAYEASLGEMSKISVSGAFQNNNFAYDEVRGGLEYSYNNLLFLRAGGLAAWGASDQIPSIFDNLTLGGGLHFANVGGVKVAVDYAYVPVEFFDNNHVVSLRLGF